MCAEGPLSMHFLSYKGKRVVCFAPFGDAEPVS